MTLDHSHSQSSHPQNDSLWLNLCRPHNQNKDQIMSKVLCDGHFKNITLKLKMKRKSFSNSYQNIITENRTKDTILCFQSPSPHQLPIAWSPHPGGSLCPFTLCLHPVPSTSPLQETSNSEENKEKQRVYFYTLAQMILPSLKIGRLVHEMELICDWVCLPLVCIKDEKIIFSVLFP